MEQFHQMLQLRLLMAGHVSRVRYATEQIQECTGTKATPDLPSSQRNEPPVVPLVHKTKHPRPEPGYPAVSLGPLQLGS